MTTSNGAPAHPALEYGPDTALLVVDVQRDFADPDGSLYVGGGEEVVPWVNDEVRRAHAAGSPVFYTQDWHPEHTPHFARDGGIWPVHCVHDTRGAELHPDLLVAGDIVQKGAGGEDGYSGFSTRHPVSGEHAYTDLRDLLGATDVRRLVVAGLAGDYCVKETALDGVRLGYQVVVPLAGTRFVELAQGDGDRAVEAMREAGVEVV